MDSLLKPTDAFVDWACNWSGMHGGNPDADLWFVGVEHDGDAGDFALDAYWQGTRTDGGLEVPAFTDAFVKEHRKVIHTWPSLRKVTKVVHALDSGWGSSRGKRGSWRKYLKKRMLRPDGMAFHANLYPIPFHDKKSEWTIEHARFSGLPNVAAYRAWCTAWRFAWLRELAMQHKPRVIVATGRSFVEDFLLTFADGDVLAAVDAPLETERGIGPARSIYETTALAGDSTLLVTPFFGGRGGLNQSVHLDALTERIRGLLDG